jgi:hypothetical protein
VRDLFRDAAETREPVKTSAADNQGIAGAALVDERPDGVAGVELGRDRDLV